MVLIGLYSLATLLLVLNIEPFKAAGVFLSICYLPGLSFFALGKRGKLLFDDLLLAFPCSIGISGMSAVVMLFMGLQAVYIAVVIHVLTGAAVLFYIFTCRGKKKYAVVEMTGQQIIFCLAAFLATLFLSVPFFMGLNRMGIAGHAFHHSIIINQILNGIFPPENPGMGGSIIGYYWGFHCLVAAITAQTNIHQLQVIFTINVLSLYLIFCIAYSFAKSYELSELHSWIFPLAIISVMRFDAGIWFIYKFISGVLTPLSEMAFPLVEPYDFMWGWLRGLPWFDSRLFFIRKFYNVSGMPLAICLCFSYLLLLRLYLKKGTSEEKVYPVSVGIVIASCFLNYPPLAVFLMLHAPVWASVLFFSYKGTAYERAKQTLNIIVPYIFAGLAVAPYMVFIIMSRDVSSGGQGEIFSFDFYDQSIKNIVVYLVPLPLIVYGIRAVSRHSSSSGETGFLLSGTVLCLFLIIFTRWPFNNSYKFNYMLAFYFAFFLAAGLQAFSKKYLRSFLTICIAAVLALNPLIIEASYLVTYLYADYKYTFSEGRLLYAKLGSRNETYSWIRENTPPESLLMLTYTESNMPCCGYNNNYEAAAITERTLYVIRDEDYTVSNPEYEKRLMFRKMLFKNPEDPAVINFFNKLGRPVYLLVDDDLEEDKFIVEERFKNFPDDPGMPFVLKYKSDKHRVYYIDIKKDADQ